MGCLFAHKSSQGPCSVAGGNPQPPALNVNRVDSFLYWHDSCSGTELALDKSFPHIEHCARVIGWVGLVNSFPVLTPDFTYISVVSSPRSYFFTSDIVWIPVHSVPKCGIEPVRYVTLDFWDRNGAAAFCYRNHTKIMVLMSEQKHYPIWFSCRAQELFGMVLS